MEKPTIITGDKLSNFETLLKIGKTFDVTNIRPISESYNHLSKYIKTLEEDGPTALGIFSRQKLTTKIFPPKFFPNYYIHFSFLAFSFSRQKT